MDLKQVLELMDSRISTILIIEQRKYYATITYNFDNPIVIGEWMEGIIVKEIRQGINHIEVITTQFYK